MLTLEINKNEVERASLVKEANFFVFLCRAKFNFTNYKPICLNFAEFEVVANRWIPQVSFKVWFISMFVLSIE